MSLPFVFCPARKKAHPEFCSPGTPCCSCHVCLSVREVRAGAKGTVKAGAVDVIRILLVCRARGDGIGIASSDLPRGEPRGFAREGFWLGKVLIFHTEVFRVVLTDKPLWDRYLLRSQPSKPLTGQLRADGTLRGSIRSLFQEPGAKSNALLW